VAKSILSNVLHSVNGRDGLAIGNTGSFPGGPVPKWAGRTIH